MPGFCRDPSTAVNLFWAIERMRGVYAETHAAGRDRLCERLEHEALALYAEDIETNRRLGRYGAALIPPQASVLTHCNAGALATAGYGTALGVIRAAGSRANTCRSSCPKRGRFCRAPG